MKSLLIGASTMLAITAPAAAQSTSGVFVAAGDYDGDSAQLDADGKVGPLTIRSTTGRAEAGGKAFELSEFTINSDTRGSSAEQRYARITLERGYTATDDLWQWKRGDVIPELKLTGKDERGRAMTVTLTNAQVTSIKYATGSGGRASAELEEIALNYQKIDIQY